jgi:hypothetical protein
MRKFDPAYDQQPKKPASAMALFPGVAICGVDRPKSI